MVQAKTILWLFEFDLFTKKMTLTDECYILQRTEILKHKMKSYKSLCDLDKRDTNIALNWFVSETLIKINEIQDVKTKCNFLFVLLDVQ